MSEVLITCRCNNQFPVSKSYCPFCNALNWASTKGECPTCGQKFPEEKKE